MITIQLDVFVEPEGLERIGSGDKSFKLHAEKYRLVNYYAVSEKEKCSQKSKT